MSASDDLRRRSENLQAQLEEQKTLNDRLENDLLRMNGPSPNGDIQHSMASMTKQDALSSLKLGKARSQQEPLVAPPGLTATAESSILPIITSQRDRFRARNAELEEVCLPMSSVVANKLTLDLRRYASNIVCFRNSETKSRLFKQTMSSFMRKSDICSPTETKVAHQKACILPPPERTKTIRN